MKIIKIIWEGVKTVAEAGGFFSAMIILVGVAKKGIAKRRAKRRKQYLAGIMSKKYINWERETLEGIYSKSSFSFVKVYDRSFPVLAIQGDASIKYPFDELTTDASKSKNKEYLERIVKKTDEHEGEKKNEQEDDPIVIHDKLNISKFPHYRQFSWIVHDQVKRPELYGYTNIGIRFSDKGTIIGLNATPRTYRETVFSCHVLQYELWKAFRKKEIVSKFRLIHRKEKRNIQPATLRDLPLRKQIHQGYSLPEIIFEGKNRSSLVDINLVILLKEGGEWKIAVGPRSQDVATFPGYWSIIPSGGFELYEKTIIPDNVTEVAFQKTIKDNFKFINTIFREYLEEVFDLEDYEQPMGHDDLRHLKNNHQIEFLDGMIKDGSAQMIFLGACFNLIVLRQTFSFALLIDDNKRNNDKWSHQQIKHNQENIEIKLRSLKDFEEDLLMNHDSPLMVELPATYELLKNCRQCKQVFSDKD